MHLYLTYIYIYTYLFILFIYLFIYVFICFPTIVLFFFMYLFIHLCICSFVYIYLEDSIGGETNQGPLLCGACTNTPAITVNGALRGFMFRVRGFIRCVFRAAPMSTGWFWPGDWRVCRTGTACHAQCCSSALWGSRSLGFWMLGEGP